MTDLRITLRGLGRTPVFTAVSILSLALGIGANTAIFSLTDQVLLRLLPVKNPHELAYLYHPGPVQGSSSSDEADGPSFSYPMFRELQKTQTPFTGLGAARGMPVSVSYQNQASHGGARLVSGNYFELLGVTPAIGRLFTEDDDRTLGGHPLVVLGHGYWTSRLGNNPAVLNQKIIVNGQTLTIIGVAQKSFTSERQGGVPDIFVPISMRKELTPDWNGMQNRKDYWVTLFGRRKPGATMEQAATAINAAYRPQLEQDVELLNRPREDFLKRFRAKKIILKPGEYGRGNLREEGSRPLFLLLGITALVLLIACANVANLQLARAAARTREVAVRLAMGASRAQLVWQLLTESCLLALAGGMLGLVAAQWTNHFIIASIPPSRFVALSSSIDARVLLYSLALSLATGILFGLFPALQASKPDLVNSLKEQSGQSTSTGSVNFFRKSLVTAQVAMSLLLLISAGLFARTLLNLARVELGVRTDHLLTFSLLPKLNQYSDERISSFYDELTDRLDAIPGVQTVSAANVPAIAGSSNSGSLSVEGFAPASDGGANASYNSVGSGYFRTMGVPLIAGREFTRADNTSAPKVAVVNEAFVRYFFGNQNPLGRRVSRSTGDNVKFDIEIVGVVKDSKYANMREAPPRVVYFPYHQNTRAGNLYFYVRTATPPENLAPLVRREVAALDPNLPIRELKTMEAQIEENMFAERLMSILTGTFAGLATILAAVGLYGVLAYNVARRTREIGIRMALGAHAGHVRGLVVREVALMLAIGMVAGVGFAAATGKFLQSVLFGLQPWDAAVYVGATVLLGLIALGAAYIPARRATNVDPMVALRYE